MTVDGRDQHKNKRKAIKLLSKKVEEHHRSLKQQKQNEIRLDRIRNSRTIRTYDFKSGIVFDHITGKRASLKEVLFKGKIDKFSKTT